MKKMLNLAALLICLVTLGVITEQITFARLTVDASSRDAWCVGIAGAEVCVDSSGNFIPTTTNVSDLGTSSLKFKNVYVAGTIAGAGITATTGVFAGQVSLQQVSSTTIVSLVPAAVGSIVYNTTRASLCVGTATVAGAWVFPSTNGVTTAGLTCKE